MKFNYYLIALIKENLIYIVSLILFIFLFIFFSFTSYKRISNLINKIFLTTDEIKELKREKELINYQKRINNEVINLKRTNEILSTLIPDNEDFFTIIKALEVISNETNFILSNYSFNPNITTASKFSLKVEGRGTQDDFFKFLEKYRYIGGRLITIDKIHYKTKGYIEVSFNVYFYSGKSNILTSRNNISELKEEEKKFLRKINKEINFKSDIDNKEIKLSYPTKTNPF